MCRERKNESDRVQKRMDGWKIDEVEAELPLMNRGSSFCWEKILMMMVMNM